MRKAYCIFLSFALITGCTTNSSYYQEEFERATQRGIARARDKAREQKRLEDERSIPAYTDTYRETFAAVELRKQKRIEDMRNNPNYTATEKEAIIAGKIFLGMSMDALIESWGKPNDINTSVGSWGAHKQFVYPNYVYVYVENEKATSWQN